MFSPRLWACCYDLWCHWIGDGNIDQQCKGKTPMGLVALWCFPEEVTKIIILVDCRRMLKNICLWDHTQSWVEVKAPPWLVCKYKWKRSTSFTVVLGCMITSSVSDIDHNIMLINPLGPGRISSYGIMSVSCCGGVGVIRAGWSHRYCHTSYVIA